MATTLQFSNSNTQVSTLEFKTRGIKEVRLKRLLHNINSIPGEDTVHFMQYSIIFLWIYLNL